MDKMKSLAREISNLRAIVTAPAIAIAIAATPAAADPDRWYLLLGSHHINTDPRYGAFNEVNPGLFAMWEGDRFDTIAGVYRNSFGRTSVSVAASKTVLQGKHAALSVFGGAAYYPGNGENFALHVGDVVPIIGINLQAGPALITILPGDGKSHDAVVALGLEVDF